MKRHGKYIFNKTSDDKLPEVQTPKARKQQRRDSLDSCCQTPSDWKEPTNYDINNLLQERSTDDKRIRGTSDIVINSKQYNINMKRHGKDSFAKTGDDKLCEVQSLNEGRREETALTSAAKH